MERARPKYAEHAESHRFQFDEYFFVYQRCKPPAGSSMPIPLTQNFRALEITEEMYPGILSSFGIKYPDSVLDELTHGWSAPHFWAHHCVNHLKVLQHAKSDYIVFADADCYVKDSKPDGPSWVEEGIKILESNPRVFVVSPSDGRPCEGLDRMMSQQMFLVRARALRKMDFIPWDGKFIDGGPFQEFYGLLEGWIYRHMEKHNLYRYLLCQDYRWWHNQW